jgi:hypothetical protein
VSYFKVVSPFLAVREAEAHGFVTVPVGAIIALEDDSPQQTLVPIQMDGENLMVFWRDLRDRSEPAPDYGRSEQPTGT